MKPTVGVLLAATTLVTISSTCASAEWRLYVNRDNKAWSLDRTFTSSGECDRAARSLYRSGQALGVGCAEHAQANASQPPPSRVAEYPRPNPPSRRLTPRAAERSRPSASWPSTPRVEEYPPPRPALRGDDVIDRSTAYAPNPPAAMAFSPSRAEEARVEVEQMLAQRAADAEKAAAASAMAAETAAREAAAAADEAQKRKALTIAAIVALTVAAGVGYSVYRVARTNPLRALSVGLIEVGLLTAALAFPVAEVWTRANAGEWHRQELEIAKLDRNRLEALLKMAQERRVPIALVVSPLPGLFAGLGIAAVGVIVLALELTRRPARSSGVGERKVQPPVESIKPVRPVEPIRPVAPLKPPETPAPVLAPSGP